MEKNISDVAFSIVGQISTKKTQTQIHTAEYFIKSFVSEIYKEIIKARNENLSDYSNKAMNDISEIFEKALTTKEKTFKNK